MIIRAQRCTHKPFDVLRELYIEAVVVRLSSVMD